MMDTQSQVRWSRAVLDPSVMQVTFEQVQEAIDGTEAQLQRDQQQYLQTQSTGDAQNMEMSRVYLECLNEWIEAALNSNSGGGDAAAAANAGAAPPQPPAAAAAQHTPLQLGVGYERALPVDNGREVRYCRCLIDQNRMVYMRVKTLQKTLYGKVSKASVLAPSAQDQRVFARTDRYAAVKEYQKDLVRRGVSRDGAPITENPVLELTVQQALGVPGHPSVLPVVNCFEDETKIYACLPLIRGGELFDFVSGHGGPMAEDTVREMMRPGFEAAHYCHSHGFAHRDISLENFLLGGEHRDRPILIDFGLACQLVSNGQGGWLPIERTHVVGKKNYMAPEVRDVNVTSYDPIKIDIWSLGVCVFIMLFGFPPWQVASTSDDHYFASVVNRQLRQVVLGWGFPASNAAMDLLEAIFVVNPQERPTIPQILGHAFFAGGGQ